jgi:tRNA (cmo5U34)-methyltransferase
MTDNTNIINGKWEFDENVTKVFDNMLERSIPSYETMRELCFDLGKHFVKTSSHIVDMGCSNGLSIERFVDEFPNSYFHLFDVSEPMLSSCKKRFADKDNVFVVNKDLRDGLPVVCVDLALCILTLQFTPIEYRQNILQDIYNRINHGGAFIIVEKVLGNSSQIDNLFVEEYYSMKKENGYTQEQISNKRKSLEGVLVPLTASFNEHLLHQAGFKYVDCFYRHLNFCGWIAIK